MRNHWRTLLQDLDYKPGETILDVGGGMDPVPIADMVIDVENFGLGGKAYTLLDLCSDKFPFPDKSFDICICSQTLEDLPSPKLAMQEISRVAKRGLIEVPHRGPESLKNTHYNGYPKPDGAMEEIWCFGTEHHKWLIEEKDGVLHFTFKNQMHLMRHTIPHWTGPGGIKFLWKDTIPYVMHYDMDQRMMTLNYSQFKEQNRQYWSS